MKYLFLFFSVFLLNCSSSSVPTQTNNINSDSIDYEELYHYNIKLINNESKIISTQKEMDDLYNKINSANSFPRKPPIPSVEEGSVYLILQPLIKNQNDIAIKSIILSDNILNIMGEEIESPEYKNINKEIAIVLKVSTQKTINKIKININPKN